MVELRVSKTVRIPNQLHLELYRRIPELGPRVLFFSGGTALREVSRHLIDYTHNSIHLITPFDSGGSSAKLRKAFKMLAVGDLRNRLMALADRTVRGQREIFELFAFRFPKDGDEEKLRRWLNRLVSGRDPMMESIADPMRRLIRNHLRYFWESMPKTFSLCGANIGNLILAGGYLNNARHIDPVIFLFSKLVQVRGVVRPVSSEYMHLAAELENGKTVVGQHLLTGREVSPIVSPIKRLFLTRRMRNPEPVELPVREKVQRLIKSADIICYPVGSFYTSVVANLLLQGLGDVIAESDVPKVYFPNSSTDVEELGMNLPRKVRTLLEYLHKSCIHPRKNKELMSYVAVDSRNSSITQDDMDAIGELGVEIIDLPLASDECAPFLAPEKIVETLISLV